MNTLHPKISIITSLYRCSRYLGAYFEAANNIVNYKECEFLLLHNSPTDDELSTINYEIQNKPWFRHIIIKDREGLYTTWNRGVKLSLGIYCAVWNVDDLRFPDSLLIQSKYLDNNSSAMYAHGNFRKVGMIGVVDGTLTIEPDTSNEPYIKTHRHLGGCFPMWRKDVHKYVGYFDEQFKLVSDLDFQIRIGLKFSFIKVDATLGSYFYATTARLSNDIKLQHIENNVVYKRYKLYSLIDPFFMFSSYGYKINSIYSFLKEEKVDKYDFNIRSDENLFILGIKSIFKFPYYSARFLKKYA